MKLKIISSLVSFLIILTVMLLKSEDLFSGNVQIIINSNPAWVTCYWDIEIINSTVAPYNEYACIDCTKYDAIRIDNQDKCNTGWIKK